MIDSSPLLARLSLHNFQNKNVFRFHDLRETIDLTLVQRKTSIFILQFKLNAFFYSKSRALSNSLMQIAKIF